MAVETDVNSLRICLLESFSELAFFVRTTKIAKMTVKNLSLIPDFDFISEKI